MRAFIAIDLPDTARAALADLQARLPVGRPVAEENLHLTLAFLDDQPPAVLEDLHDDLSGLRARGFELHLSGLGGPGGAAPALIWIAADPSPPLVQLRARVEAAARRAGIALPRQRFRPHVTLARFGRRRLGGGERARLQAFLTAEGALRLDPVPVRDIALWQSSLHRDGPVYDELARYPLRG